MKKLLIGLVALTSVSAFSDDICVRVQSSRGYSKSSTQNEDSSGNSVTTTVRLNGSKGNRKGEVTLIAEDNHGRTTSIAVLQIGENRSQSPTFHAKKGLYFSFSDDGNKLSFDTKEEFELDSSDISLRAYPVACP